MRAQDSPVGSDGAMSSSSTTVLSHWTLEAGLWLTAHLPIQDGTRRGAADVTHQASQGLLSHCRPELGDTAED